MRGTRVSDFVCRSRLCALSALQMTAQKLIRIHAFTQISVTTHHPSDETLIPSSIFDAKPLEPPFFLPVNRPQGPDVPDEAFDVPDVFKNENGQPGAR